MIYVYGKPEAGILTVESDTLLTGIEITDMTGGKVETTVLCEKNGRRHLYDSPGCLEPDAVVARTSCPLRTQG